jgi:hypothetical protein
VTTLKTSHQWQQEGRQVLEEHYQHHSASEQKESTNGNSSSPSVYGIWQTEEIPDYKQPVRDSVSADGIIPVNKHGNVCLWDGREDLVPTGAAYVASPHALSVCEQLGFHHAPALIGFKSIGIMLKAPVIAGAVVLQHQKELVEDTCTAIDVAEKMEKKKKKYIKICGKWVRLCKILLSRDQLKDRYGH